MNNETNQTRKAALESHTHGLDESLADLIFRIENHRPIVLRVVDVVGKYDSITQEEGLRVYKAIKLMFERGLKVSLSFAEIEDVSTKFLRPLLLRLCEHFGKDKLRNCLMISDVESQEIKNECFILANVKSVRPGWTI